ncbi:unnamed protein product [Pieris macdunnoughi]|uniref:Endonuclease/exonuclease/phosphatase domain-containing protein n=1 Tax=Pieris macdunnoughi TaxID=345717 RepID=A0A821YB38_9NEOP|nr:unnamed protein product [Pieris macdunnoughi]
MCNDSDLVALQETWLLPHDIPILGTISNNFDYTGKSAVDTSAGLLTGRPYGGVAILWRVGVFGTVSVIDCNSPSEAHGTRRWLDHCVVSVSAWHTVINVEIKEDVYMSDHLPIFLECDLGVVRYKNLISDLSRSAVTWGERDNAQINSYRDLCNNYLKGVDFPQELASCCHRSCSLPGHKLITT